MNNKITFLVLTLIFLSSISIFAGESANFTLQQSALVSSSAQTESINFSLNPGLLGEPFGGNTQSENFSFHSGYNPNASTDYAATRYINITGTINDVSTNFIWAQDLEGLKYGTITDTTFKIENVFVESGQNILAITCTDQAGNSSTQDLTVYFDPVPPSLPQLTNFNSPTANSSETIAGTKEQYTSLWINDLERIPASYPTGDYNLQHNIENWDNILLSFNEGENSLEIYCKDRAGNKSASLNSKIILDAAAGNIQINSPYDGDFVKDETITVTGSYDENSPNITVNEVEAAIDETAKTFSVNISLTEGNNSIQAVLTSLLGNQNQDNIGIVLDTIGPKIISFSPAQPQKVYEADTLSLSLDIEDEFFKYLYLDLYFDGIIIESLTIEPEDSLQLQLNGYTIPEDSFGRKTLQFTVMDSAGSLDSESVDMFVLKKPVLP